jgi:DnaJ-domain-containing protein 1
MRIASRTISPWPSRRPETRTSSASGRRRRHTAWIQRLAANPDTGFRGSNPNGAGVDPDQEDHYSLLGVPFTATHAEITRAYRRAMKHGHPDRQLPERRAAFEELARRLNAAYATLSDPLKRQAYDRTIRQQVIQDQIMSRYVGGFQTFDERTGAGTPHRWREPTETERRERIAADRQASITLVFIAVGVTVLILISLVIGSLLSSLLETIL